MLFSISFNFAMSCSRSSLKGVGGSEVKGTDRLEANDFEPLSTYFEIFALLFFLLLRHPVVDLGFY